MHNLSNLINYAINLNLVPATIFASVHALLKFYIFIPTTKQTINMLYNNRFGFEIVLYFLLLMLGFTEIIRSEVGYTATLDINNLTNLANLRKDKFSEEIM